MKIRKYNSSNWAEIWTIIKPVFRAGETYAYSPEISEAAAHEIWITSPKDTFIALDDNGQILGTYFIKPNQAELGSHVCNCGYIVSEDARGKGVASSLCKHSLILAKALGFRAMQYNLVVSSNIAAIHLWKKTWF